MPPEKWLELFVALLAICLCRALNWLMTASDRRVIGFVGYAVFTTRFVGMSSDSATNLPAGLLIDANTGLIGGTLDPGSAGSYSVTVFASDGALTGSASP